jgi:hypothetical protein
VTFGGGVILGLRSALAQLGQEDYFLTRVREEVVFRAFERSAKTTNLSYASLDNTGGSIGAALLSQR